eukprot:scaffold12660_cov20-Tisochrysis_lutea.AAC.3
MGGSGSLATLLAMDSSLCGFAQDLVGDWEGPATPNMAGARKSQQQQQQQQQKLKEGSGHALADDAAPTTPRRQVPRLGCMLPPCLQGPQHPCTLPSMFMH